MIERLEEISPPPSHFEDCLSLGDGYQCEHHLSDPEWSQEQHSDLLRKLHSFLAVHQVAQEQGVQHFSEKLHRNQALAQLSNEYFLRQGPQRSLSRFLTDPWGRDLTDVSMDGCSAEQRGSVQGWWTRPCGRQSTQTRQHHRGIPTLAGGRTSHIFGMKRPAAVRLHELMSGRIHPGTLVLPGAQCETAVHQFHTGLSIFYHYRDKCAVPRGTFGCSTKGIWDREYKASQFKYPVKIICMHVWKVEASASLRLSNQGLVQCKRA